MMLVLHNGSPRFQPGPSCFRPAGVPVVPVGADAAPASPCPAGPGDTRSTFSPTGQEQAPHRGPAAKG